MAGTFSAISCVAIISSRCWLRIPIFHPVLLAPCPSSGIIIQGAGDTVVTPLAVQKLVDKLRTQKHITIHHDEIPRANHFYENEMELLLASVENYLDMRLDPACPIK